MGREKHKKKISNLSSRSYPRTKVFFGLMMTVVTFILLRASWSSDSATQELDVHDNNLGSLDNIDNSPVLEMMLSFMMVFRAMFVHANASFTAEPVTMEWDASEIKALDKSFQDTPPEEEFLSMPFFEDGAILTSGGSRRTMQVSPRSDSPVIVSGSDSSFARLGSITPLVNDGFVIAYMDGPSSCALSIYSNDAVQFGSYVSVESNNCVYEYNKIVPLPNDNFGVIYGTNEDSSYPLYWQKYNKFGVSINARAVIALGDQSGRSYADAARLSNNNVVVAARVVWDGIPGSSGYLTIIDDDAATVVPPFAFQATSVDRKPFVHANADGSFYVFHEKNLGIRSDLIYQKFNNAGQELVAETKLSGNWETEESVHHAYSPLKSFSRQLDNGNIALAWSTYRRGPQGSSSANLIRTMNTQFFSPDMVALNATKNDISEDLDNYPTQLVSLPNNEGALCTYTTNEGGSQSFRHWAVRYDASGVPVSNPFALMEDVFYDTYTAFSALLSNGMLVLSHRMLGTSLLNFKLYSSNNTLTVVNGAMLTSQNILTDQLYSYTLPSSLFNDPDMDQELMYRVLFDGGNLPGWLFFSSSPDLALSGYPQAGDVTQSNITIFAWDGVGPEVNVTFQLNVRRANQQPVLAIAPSDQQAGVGLPFEYSLPLEMFTDGDGDLLEYSAEWSGHSWLIFFAGNRTLSGIPTRFNIGGTEILIHVDDGFAGFANASFNLEVQPTLSASQLDQQLTYTRNTGYDLPNMAVTSTASSDAEVVMALSSVLAGSITTPSSGLVASSFDTQVGRWAVTGAIAEVNAILSQITFNPALGYHGHFSLAVNVTDSVNHPQMGLWEFTEATDNREPSVAFNLPVQTLSVGIPFNYTFAENTFIDGDGDSLGFAMFQSGGRILPSSLLFNAGQRRLSGTISKEFTEEGLNLEVLASDPYGGEVIASQQLPVIPSLTAERLTQTGKYTASVPYQLRAITITSDAVSEVSATLVLSNPQAATLSTPSSNGVTSTFNVITGQWSTSGPYAEVSVLLNTLELTVTAGYNSVFTLAAQVSDAINHDLIGTMTMAEVGTNQAPILTDTIPDQVVGVGENVTINVPPNTFTDPDEDELLYLATKNSGSALSGYLSFDPIAVAFVAAPTKEDKGEEVIRIISNDGYGGSASTSFAISVVPTLTTTLLDKVLEFEKDAPYSFTGFTINGLVNYPVTLRLTLLDPQLGSFNAPFSGGVISIYQAASGTWFSMGPASEVEQTLNKLIFMPKLGVKGQVSMRAELTDSVNEDIDGELLLRTPNHPPRILEGISNFVLEVGKPFSYSISPSSLYDEDGDPMKAMMKLDTGADLPVWLNFNPDELRLFGTPEEGDIGEIAVKLTVDDLLGGQDVDTFSIRVQSLEESSTNFLGLDDATMLKVASSVGGVLGSIMLATLGSMWYTSTQEEKAKSQEPIAFAIYKALNLALPYIAPTLKGDAGSRDRFIKSINELISALNEQGFPLEEWRKNKKAQGQYRKGLNAVVEALKEHVDMWDSTIIFGIPWLCCCATREIRLKQLEDSSVQNSVRASIQQRQLETTVEIVTTNTNELSATSVLSAGSLRGQGSPALFKEKPKTNNGIELQPIVSDEAVVISQEVVSGSEMKGVQI